MKSNNGVASFQVLDFRNADVRLVMMPICGGRKYGADPVEPTVSVVLASYNRKAFLKRTLQSIRSEAGGLVREIIVVDGGSSDGSVGWLASQRDVITIIQHNRGRWRGQPLRRRSWGYFINLAFKAASGKYLLMVSDDCLVQSDAVTGGVEFFEKELAAGNKVGAVPFYWRNWPEMSDYWVGRTLGGVHFVNHGLYLAQAISEVGYASEEPYQFYCADGDLCLKMHQRGWLIKPCGDAFIDHYSHANVSVRKSNDLFEADYAAYLERWSGIYDPAGQGWDWRKVDSGLEACMSERTAQSWCWLHRFNVGRLTEQGKDWLQNKLNRLRYRVRGR